jgi:hypothetical protein
METARERERERARLAEEDRVLADGRAEAVGEFFGGLHAPAPVSVVGQATAGLGMLELEQ